MKPKALTPARIQLHYAIQFSAMVGAALATPVEDYSHTSLTWDPDLKVFIGAMIQGNQPFRVALDPVNLIVLILDQEQQHLATFSLDQQTFDQGLIWLKTELSRLGVAAEKVVPLTYPSDDFPDHPIAHGASFDASQVEDRQALVNTYNTTFSILQTVVTQDPNASPIRIWPHHFDMASLISVPTPAGEEPRSVGAGFSPGDAGIAEPYWYITPWPYPPADQLPPLETKGVWQTEGWTGAVLVASDIGDLEYHQADLEAFVTGAIKASKQVLS